MNEREPQFTAYESPLGSGEFYADFPEREESFQRLATAVLHNRDVARERAGDRITDPEVLRCFLEETNKAFAGEWDGYPRNAVFDVALANLKLSQARTLQAHLHPDNFNIGGEAGGYKWSDREHEMIVLSTMSQQAIIRSLIVAPDEAAARRIVNLYGVMAATRWDKSALETYQRQQNGQFTIIEAKDYSAAQVGVTAHVAAVRFMRHGFPQMTLYEPNPLLDVHRGVDFALGETGKKIGILMQIKGKRSLPTPFRFYVARGDWSKDNPHTTYEDETRALQRLSRSVEHMPKEFKTDMAPHTKGVMLMLRPFEPDHTGAFDATSGFCHNSFLESTAAEEIRRELERPSTSSTTRRRAPRRKYELVP